MTRRINAYVCTTCQGLIVTVDRAEGVTPMFLSCRATPFCQGRMQSAMYPEELQDYRLPTFEWYSPDEKERRRLSPEVRDHVWRGGLLLRQVGFKTVGTTPFRGEMMTCCMCGKQVKSHIRIESGWTTVDLEDVRYYFCPAEIPGKRGTKQEFADAYMKIYRHIMGENAAIDEHAVVKFFEHHKIGSN